MTPEPEPDEAERAAGFLEDAWWEDHDAWDFAAEPAPVDGADEDQINRRMLAYRHHLRRLDGYDQAAESELAAFDRLAEAKRLEIEERIARNRAPLVQPVEYLGRVLELTGLAIVAKDPKHPTIAVPAGKLVVGGGGVEWEWSDEPDVLADQLAYVRENCPVAYDVPQPEPRVLKNKLKAAVKDLAVVMVDGRQAPAHAEGLIVDRTGCPIPGVLVKPKPRTITVEPSREIGF